MRSLRRNFQFFDKKKAPIQNTRRRQSWCSEILASGSASFADNRKITLDVYKRQVLGHSKGGGVSTQFQKGKSFDDYSSAIQAKFVPRTLNIADLVENRVYQGEKIVQRKAFFDQMRACLLYTSFEVRQRIRHR